MTTKILHSPVMCYICGSEAFQVLEARPIAYGGLTIDVDDEFLRCATCGEEFYGPGQAEAVDVRASAAARKTDRILPFEIRAIRKKFGLTQRDLEAQFGLGSKVVTRWERGLSEPPTPTVLLLRALERGTLSIETLRPDTADLDTELTAMQRLVGTLFDSVHVVAIEDASDGMGLIGDRCMDAAGSSNFDITSWTPPDASDLADKSLALAA